MRQRQGLGERKTGEEMVGCDTESRLDWEAIESSRVKGRVLPLPRRRVVGDRKCLKEKSMLLGNREKLLERMQLGLMG